jgi:transmembrane protein
MNVRPLRQETPGWIAAILDSRSTWLLARIALTLPYWWSGIDKALHPQAALAEVGGLLGTSTPLPFYVALLVVQLGGSLLVIFNRWAWLGAGALGVFTLIVTLIAHAFWKLDGPARFAEMNTFMEHMALIAGFLLAAMIAQRSQNPSESNPR